MHMRFHFIVIGLIFFSGCRGSFSPRGFELTVCEPVCSTGEVCTENGCRELCDSEEDNNSCSHVGFICSNDNICDPAAAELKPFVETIDGNSIHLSDDDVAVNTEGQITEHRVATAILLTGRNLAGAKVELLDAALNLHELNTDTAANAEQIIAQLPENFAAGRYLLKVYNEFGIVENSITILQGESGLMGPIGPEGQMGEMGPMPEFAIDGFFIGTGEIHSPLALNMDKVAGSITDLGFVKPGADGFLNSTLLPPSTVQTSTAGLILGNGSADTPLGMDVGALAAVLPTNIPEALLRLDSSGTVPSALLPEQAVNLNAQGLLYGDGTAATPLGMDVDALAAVLPTNMAGGLLRLSDLNLIPEALLPYSAIGNYSDARYLSLEQVISQEVFISVGTSSDAMFASIPEALDFLGDRIITSKGLVRIQVEPGYYEHDDPLNFNHRDGARIEIVGVPNNPDAVTLYFAGVGGLAMSTGTTLKLFVGFKLQGDGETGIGIYATTHARLSLGTNENGDGPGVKVSGFTHGIYANYGSHISAPYVQSSYNASSGFLAYRSATIDAYGSRSEHNGAHGFVSGWGGFLTARDAYATHNGTTGFYAVYHATLHTKGATASYNGHSGFRAWGNSHLYAGNGTLAQSNTSYGVYAQHGSYIYFSSSSSTGNGTADIVAFYGGRISSGNSSANSWMTDGADGSAAQNTLSSRGSYIAH
jgi:hypothetical protein